MSSAASASSSSRPAPGTYAIALGDSFRQTKQLHMIKYDFKPQSADNSTVADLEVNSDKTTTLICASNAQPNSNIEFRGVYTHATAASSTGATAASASSSTDDGCTCLLTYDPVTQQFTLDRIESTYRLKQMHAEEDEDEEGRRQRQRTTTTNMIRPARRRGTSMTEEMQDNEAPAPDESLAEYI